jgi:hypothetical protein
MLLHFGDVPTGVAAVGTVGTLVAALWQIHHERKRRIAQEAKDREERHREQARLVSAVLGPEDAAMDQTTIDLINRSDEPVYGLVVAIVFIQGAGPQTTEEMIEIRADRPDRPVTTASVLPSGVFRVHVHGTGWSRILAGRSGVEVAFTDRSGSHWIRRALGRLEELPEEPLKYFAHSGFVGPHDLQTPRRMP